MVLRSPERGYFSIVRWCTDAERDEARNVAVVLVDAEGQFGGVRSAPPSSLSQDLRQQGLLDAVLHGLALQFQQERRPDLRRLQQIATGLTQSLYLTEPRATAVPDPDLTLQALYRAYVAPTPQPRRALTKGVVIDRVVQGLRRRGLHVRRGEYMGEFFFDALVETEGNVIPFDVLSFAGDKKDWLPTERDAGHFLYGLARLGLPGRAVIQPPAGEGAEAAEVTWTRVRRWFDEAHVPVLQPDEVADPNMSLSLGL
jgi:hypothetical protein